MEQIDAELPVPGDIALRFYFVRHGEAEGNVAGIRLGQSESPLTAHGRVQAAAAGKSLASTVPVFWRFYSSDLGRTVETATVLKNARQRQFLSVGNSATKDPDGSMSLEASLRERAKGVYELKKRGLTYQEAYSEHLRRGGSPDTIPLEETDDEVFTRVRQWIKRVLDEAIDEISADRKLIDAAFNLSVLCVSHSGLIRATLGHLFNIDSSEISVPNASISIVEIKAGGCDGFIAKLVQPPDDSHMGPESYSR
eukprot:CAMPEP_0113331280 /NCGR_PEP_ID=MMETSP0010_2-20120614/22375_1 /TAXON_ID=216773 ORGANISM="Corethron hystrix, Strain 308" /NCGR_SAMPLE_ID=MMETSP0010_2 /ASSEMBLY_ACC=CAM_ASM_000155 /LENGTH=252 /DNA_ID=CAMNT_0000194477 /DNA_START=84 /DNA_END=839 /DNA_ORIENTATION=- /assembly_acc=CAM_ASM_000155